MNSLYISLLFCLCSCILKTALSYKVLSTPNGLLRLRHKATRGIKRTQFASPVQLKEIISSSCTALAAGGRPPRERGGLLSCELPVNHFYNYNYFLWLSTLQMYLSFLCRSSEEKTEGRCHILHWYCHRISSKCHVQSRNRRWHGSSCFGYHIWENSKEFRTNCRRRFSHGWSFCLRFI